MVKAAAGAIAVRALKGRRRWLPPAAVPGRRLEGVGGGGAVVGREDSVVPAGPRGWERRAPIFVRVGFGCCGCWSVRCTLCQDGASRVVVGLEGSLFNVDG